MRRRLIAIGDLHGDVHRLVRILQRHEVFLHSARKWAKAAAAVDVVLLGDYVDWRGEPLEGERATWDRGVADLLELIVEVHGQVDEIAASAKGAKPRFVTLLGNHDKLMLDSFRRLSAMPAPQRAAIAAAHTDVRALRAALTPTRSLLSRVLGRSAEPDKQTMCILTWMANGGPSTVRSFGGFQAWYDRMASGLADFMERRMPLGVVINGRLYSHSVPDDPKLWTPPDAVSHLAPDARDAVIDEWVWGRRIYGRDYKTGKPIDKPRPEEIDQMLGALGVKGIVVGHSLMQSLVPTRAYEGKVVNIDLHGHPMSDPWVEEYEG